MAERNVHCSPGVGVRVAAHVGIIGGTVALRVDHDYCQREEWPAKELCNRGFAPTTPPGKALGRKDYERKRGKSVEERVQYFIISVRFVPILMLRTQLMQVSLVQDIAPELMERLQDPPFPKSMGQPQTKVPVVTPSGPPFIRATVAELPSTCSNL